MSSNLESLFNLTPPNVLARHQAVYFNNTVYPQLIKAMNLIMDTDGLGEHPKESIVFKSNCFLYHNGKQIHHKYMEPIFKVFLNTHGPNVIIKRSGVGSWDMTIKIDMD